MNNKIIPVKLKEHSYNIVISDNNYAGFACRLKNLNIGRDAVIITVNYLKQNYAPSLADALKKHGFNTRCLTIPDSEKSKSLTQYENTVSQIAAFDIRQQLFLVAFGGGVVGDLTGFIAATYKRGIPYVQLPTTLLAQVDSAIGGKTALDLPTGKNLVGAFYQPRLVFSGISILNTLPKRQIQSGLAEVIKYAVVFDRDLFNYLERNAREILTLKRDKILHIVAKCSALKAGVVAIDELEKSGYRTLLNYGHTIGHALETAHAYSQALSHGEAVAVGMIGAAEIAFQLGLLAAGQRQRIEGLILKYNLPTRIKYGDINAIIQAQQHDKKNSRHKNRWVLPTKIGHAAVVTDIPQDLIKNTLIQLKNG